jgi:hypothetical protein
MIHASVVIAGINFMVALPHLAHLSAHLQTRPLILFPCSTAYPLSTSPTSLSPTVDTILPPSLKRRLHTLPDTPSSSTLSSQSSRSFTPLRTSQPTHPPDLERSYGELDTYPLRRSSVLCKATGGGRWEPKQIPVLDGYRQPIPGGKAPYEIEMEREELLDRQRRENPVIKDGEFQYRFARVPEPLSIARSPRFESTFWCLFSIFPPPLSIHSLRLNIANGEYSRGSFIRPNRPDISVKCWHFSVKPYSSFPSPHGLLWCLVSRLR